MTIWGSKRNWMQKADSQASLDVHVTEHQSRTVLSKSNLIVHETLEYISPPFPTLSSGGYWMLGQTLPRTSVCSKC